MSDMDPDVSLSAEEFDDLLSREAVVVLGSVNADGSPHLAPVWPIKLADAIYVETGSRTKKARNLLRCETFALSVGFGPWGPSGLISGTAREVSDTLIRSQVRDVMVRRYYGSSSDPGYAKMQAEYERSGGSNRLRARRTGKNLAGLSQAPARATVPPRPVRGIGSSTGGEESIRPALATMRDLLDRRV